MKSCDINILDPNFREFEHIKNLLQMSSSEAANSFMEDSLTYAMSYAAGGLREALAKTEQLQNVINYFSSFVKLEIRLDSCATLELKATRQEFPESSWKKLKET